MTRTQNWKDEKKGFLLSINVRIKLRRFFSIGPCLLRQCDCFCFCILSFRLLWLAVCREDIDRLLLFSFLFSWLGCCCCISVCHEASEWVQYVPQHIINFNVKHFYNIFHFKQLLSSFLNVLCPPRHAGRSIRPESKFKVFRHSPHLVICSHSKAISS